MRSSAISKADPLLKRRHSVSIALLRRLSAVRGLVKTGTELLALKTRSPFVWSPCSCVRSTPERDLASMPWVFKCPLILFALNPMSIKTAVFPACSRVTFPALPLAIMVTRMMWNSDKKDARKLRFYRFYQRGELKTISRLHRRADCLL